MQNFRHGNYSYYLHVGTFSRFPIDDIYTHLVLIFLTFHFTDHNVLMATESAKSAVKTIATINQVSNNISNNRDVMEQTKTMLSQHAGWEEFLIPAPMTIAFLGQLMLIGTLKDFPVDRNIPKQGFKYLKHPKSFRASVVQVICCPILHMSVCIDILVRFAKRHLV